MWGFGTSFSHVWVLLHNFTCYDLIPIFHRCEDLVLILHICEKNSTNSLNLRRIVQVLHKLKINKNVKFEHIFYTPKIIKIHRTQISRLSKGTYRINYSHGVKFTKCEICGSTGLCYVTQLSIVLNYRLKYIIICNFLIFQSIWLILRQIACLNKVLHFEFTCFQCCHPL